MDSWINKLNIKWDEHPDGSGNITVEWDETDLSLKTWTSWGEDKQKQFILDALTIAVSDALPEDETESLRLT